MVSASISAVSTPPVQIWACSKEFVSFTGILNSRIVAPRRSSSSDVRRPAFLSVWIFAAFKSTDANFLKVLRRFPGKDFPLFSQEIPDLRLIKIRQKI